MLDDDQKGKYCGEEFTKETLIQMGCMFRVNWKVSEATTRGYPDEIQSTQAKLKQRTLQVNTENYGIIRLN